MSTTAEHEKAAPDADSAQRSDEEKRLSADQPSDEEKGTSAVSEEEAHKAAMAAQLNAPPPRKFHGFLWILVVVGLFSSSFLFALDNTIVANIQPAIILALDGADKIAWAGVAFSISSSATVLTWLQCYRNFNLKVLFCSAVILFEVGSAICGAAHNMNMFIGGRVICGVGGVGMYIGVMNFLPNLTSLKERPMYISALGVTWGVGTVLGPVIGGAFTDSSATWRWSFYINLCFGAIGAPAYLFLLPFIDPAPGKTMKERFSQLDWLGSLLMMGALAAGTIGINCGGVLYPWGSPGIIVALVLGGVGLIVFYLQQKFCIFTSIDTRLFPMELWTWKEPTRPMVFIAFFCSAAAVTVPTYIIPLYFQFTIGASALGASWRLLPFVLLLVFTCLLTGQVLPRFGYYMPMYLIAGILNLIGGCLIYTISRTTHEGAVFGFIAIIGLGAGMIMQIGHSVVQANTPKPMIKKAVAFTTTALLNGVSSSLVLAQCIFQNEAKKRIGWVLPGASDQTITNAISGADSTFVADQPPAIQDQIVAAVVRAINLTFVLIIVSGAVTILLSVFMKRERLFK